MTSRRNQFSALYSESESENSDYHSTEEKSLNQTEDHLELEALSPEEDKFDPLASSTIIEGVELLKPDQNIDRTHSRNYSLKSSPEKEILNESLHQKQNLKWPLTRKMDLSN